MDNDQHDIAPFLEDPSFREWVYNPTPALNSYWESFQQLNPDKVEAIKLAIELLRYLQSDIQSDLPEENITNRLLVGIQQVTHPTTHAKINFRPWLWMAACSIALLALVSYIFYVAEDTTNQVKEITYEHLVEESDSCLKEFSNCKEVPVTVTLSDSSEVKLEPGSKISYSANFGANNRREVYLEGTAFFNVKKNKHAPFIVYANELVTTVLGTSFWILKLKDTNELLVEVVTGKVAVSTKYTTQLKTEEKMDTEGQVLVTPNQQLLFSRSDITIRKSLISRPLVIQMPLLKEELEFDDVPVGKVFSTIEKAYGVEIHYDEQRFEKCLVTASLTGEPLYETIGAICEAINARYHVADTKITIEGYGCRS